MPGPAAACARKAASRHTARAELTLCLCSIITLGQAGEALLIKSSPVQTSAAELLSDLANSTVILPLAFANVSSVRYAAQTSGRMLAAELNGISVDRRPRGTP